MVPVTFVAAAVPRPQTPRQHPPVSDGKGLELPAGRCAKELVELTHEHLDAFRKQDIPGDLCAQGEGVRIRNTIGAKTNKDEQVQVRSRASQ
jgi:hypothetical protein